jgi:hypothetical protein
MSATKRLGPPSAKRVSLANVNKLNSLIDPLDAPDQNQHQYNDEYQAQASTRVISPASAIGPRGECANEQQNQDDQQNGVHV